ncbi:unnamed protein product [Effrenium voratum]|nr:unnamed protein product [Effrenium voratum]
MIGSLLGVSTVGTFAESSAGVADGAKTGLAPLVTGTWPGPVLALIGVTMMSSIKDMDWKNAEEAIPAFIAIVTMPYCFSIGYGIVAGLGCWLFFQILLAPIRLWRKESPFVRFQVGVSVCQFGRDTSGLTAHTRATHVFMPFRTSTTSSPGMCNCTTSTIGAYA